MPRRLALPLLVLLALAGCTRSREVVAPPNADRPNDVWRSLVTEDDRARLRHWRKSWTDALAAAQPVEAAAIAREGALLDPDAALPGVRLPSGAELDGVVFYRGVDAGFATQRDVSRTKRDIKTFEVRLRCDNKDRRLAVGMTAYVLLPLK